MEQATSTAQLTRIELDVCYATGEDLANVLGELIGEAGDVKIVGVLPKGPGGGWPAVTFESTPDGLRQILWRYAADGGDYAELLDRYELT